MRKQPGPSQPSPLPALLVLVLVPVLVLHREAAMTTTITTNSSTYSDDLPISTWYQKEQRQEQQDHKMPPPCPHLRVDPSPPVPRPPSLVVGPGRFGGKVGLLDALQPPELTKYLTVSEWEQIRNSVFRLPSLTQRHLLTYPYTPAHTHTHNIKSSLKKMGPPSVPGRLAPTSPT